jgi:hypothetical protein
MNYLAAWTVLRPPLPSLSANCCKARGFKPRVRNVRRLQLVFFCGFTRWQNLDMPCAASEPMSKPMQPQDYTFYACAIKSALASPDIFIRLAVSIFNNIVSVINLIK